MVDRPVLVTGATGYIGGRLIPFLTASNIRVRAMARSLAKLKGRPFASHPLVECVQGDVLDPHSLFEACKGCRAAFYLVHSMNPSVADFHEADQAGAVNMAAAASAAGMERILYLGGLGDDREGPLSRHLASRQETGRVLSGGPVPVTTLRAAMILGSGSASFEIMRYLVERLPVMVTPRWVRTPVQPIAVRDVLHYLKGCLQHPETSGKTYDIGGPDILDYQALFAMYAEEAGLPRRVVIPVPVLTPKLSAMWIHLVTPVPASIAMPLSEGLKVPVVCREDRIREILPGTLLSCREAIRTALVRIREHAVPTCWSDAGCLEPPEWAVCGDADYAGGTVLSIGYAITVAAPVSAVWDRVVRVGGDTGWYFADILWRIRGVMDRWIGGIGLRRGRRDPDKLQVGDVVDFFRVLELQPGRKLVLLVEMKIPGQALLSFELDDEPGGVRLSLVARFLPRGLTGLLYWYGLDPIHHWLYRRMLLAVVKAAGGSVVSGPVKITRLTEPACEA